MPSLHKGRLAGEDTWFQTAERLGCGSSSKQPVVYYSLCCECSLVFLNSTYLDNPHSFTFTLFSPPLPSPGWGGMMVGRREQVAMWSLVASWVQNMTLCLQRKGAPCGELMCPCGLLWTSSESAHPSRILNPCRCQHVLQTFLPWPEHPHGYSIWQCPGSRRRPTAISTAFLSLSFVR